MIRFMGDHTVAWARAWETDSGLPGHDAEAARLVRLLGRELGEGFQVLYEP